jgi:hypothetical protein
MMAPILPKRPVGRPPSKKTTPAPKPKDTRNLVPAVSKTTAPVTRQEMQSERRVMYVGASLTELRDIFKVASNRVKEAISHCTPTGVHMNTHLYAIRDVAEYLVQPKVDIGEYIKKMSPQDLNPYMLKEYWNGMHAQLRYEELAGDLWRTADVQIMIGEVFKTLRLSLLLLGDQVEREIGLTDEQRNLIKRLIDNTMKVIRESLATDLTEIAKVNAADRAGSDAGKESSEDRPENFDDSADSADGATFRQRRQGKGAADADEEDGYADL